MKKLIYVLIGIITFSIGFCLYQFRSVFITIQNDLPVSSSSCCEISQHEFELANSTELSTDVPVSLCEISQRIELYPSQQLRMKAYLEFEIEGTFFVSDFRKSCVTSARLEIAEGLKKNKKFRNLVNSLRRKNDELTKNKDESGLYLVQIEIVGEINKTKNTENAGILNPPPFEIKASEIKQISPIRFVSYQEVSDFRESK